MEIKFLKDRRLELKPGLMFKLVHNLCFSWKVHGHMVKIAIAAEIQILRNHRDPWSTLMPICTHFPHTLHLPETHWTIQLLLPPLVSLLLLTYKILLLYLGYTQLY